MKYLIITSSGGGAHLTVAKAERDRLKKVNPHTSFEVVDIMGMDCQVTTDAFKNKSWIPNYGIPLTNITFFSGHTNINHWDSSQKMGGLRGVKKLERLIDCQPLAESIQSSTIYENLKNVIQNNPDLEEIIDTQALSTPDICRAVSEENRRRASLTPPGKSIIVRKIISEFITDKTVHYLDPLSRVKKEDAACLSVEIVNDPLRSQNETVDEFYQRKNLSHIHFVKVAAPLRSAFRENHVAKVYVKAVTVKESSSDPIDKNLIEEPSFIIQSLGDWVQPHDHEHFKIDKQADDKFFTITLGSQGSITILRYIDAFIDEVLHTDIPARSRMILFVAAGKNDGTSNTMYAMVRRHLEQRKADLNVVGIKWPESAKILPLSFQDDLCMASLFQNSDVLITRTGGMSSIESHETQALNPTRKVLLHSEAAPTHSESFPKNQFDACYQCLMPGTVRWEGGNAQYLMQRIDACLTSPETVLFNIDHQAKFPTYQGSLVELAANGQFNTQHFDAIKTNLEHGSDPNVESLTGLPVMAYALDIPTLRQCIRYGGQLTPSVYKHLVSQGLDHQALDKLKNLEIQIAGEILKHGVPLYARRAFISAIYLGDINRVKGMIYRFPSLVAMKLSPGQGEKLLPLEQIANRLKKFEIQRLIEHIKGASPLYLAMEEANDRVMDQHQLKRIIFFNQQELNRQYQKGVTPLTLCKDKELRQLMVSFGANPYYLDKSISEDERASLKKRYQESEIAYNDLRLFIIKTYKKYANNEDSFCKSLSRRLERDFECETQFAKSVAQSTFFDLKLANTEMQKMGVLEKIINIIKQYLFGTDPLNRQSQLQSRKLMFYKADLSLKKDDMQISMDDIDLETKESSPVFSG